VSGAEKVRFRFLHMPAGQYGTLGKDEPAFGEADVTRE
jgi:hypothetical protein